MFQEYSYCVNWGKNIIGDFPSLVHHFRKLTPLTAGPPRDSGVCGHYYGLWILGQNLTSPLSGTW